MTYMTVCYKGGELQQQCAYVRTESVLMFPYLSGWSHDK